MAVHARAAATAHALTLALRRLNPYAEYMYDGINLSPFEVMFVKMKEYLLEANWTTATEIKKYTEWARDRVSGGSEGGRGGDVGEHRPPPLRPSPGKGLGPRWLGVAAAH